MQFGITPGDLREDVLLIIVLFVFKFAPFTFVDPHGEAFLIPGARFAPLFRSLCAGKMPRPG
jgi:hypothetical protein